ncbi:MAG: radical SAM/SPASM domain-containing protein [Bacteroidota bacterium]
MKQFKKIFIEITNACNLNCSYCSSGIRKTEAITIDSFQHIINEIKPYSDYVYLHVKGEPFLHPHLKELLNICFSKNIQVNITTNGTLVNNVKDILFESKAVRQINFSLHSFDLNQNTKNKNQSIINIISFTKEALKNSKIFIALRLWNLDNGDEDKLIKNHQILNLLEEEFELPYKIIEKYKAGNSIKISERLFLNFDNEFRWPNETDEIISDKGFCHALRDQAAILVDGTVVPCCLDCNGIINLGNIHLQTFESIINSERALKIHDGFSDNKAVETLCKKCRFKERF